MDLKPEQKTIGKENYNGAVGMQRRDFLGITNHIFLPTLDFTICD